MQETMLWGTRTHKLVASVFSILHQTKGYHNFNPSLCKNVKQTTIQTTTQIFPLIASLVPVYETEENSSKQHRQMHMVATVGRNHNIGKHSDMQQP
jgi:hypothetical protein